MSLCLSAGALLVSLQASAVTLAWTHSVEKTRWEEDWRRTPAGLILDEARVQGSGAGMDPPEEARLVGGFWRWRPALPPQAAIVLRRSGATADYQVCIAGACRDMGSYLEAALPAEADPVTLKACP
jgi:hypothetical protein